MRWHSTGEPSASDEVSVLAIVETIAAVCIAIGISIWLGTIKYIAVAFCIAPLLLLRTERSNAHVRRWLSNDSPIMTTKATIFLLMFHNRYEKCPRWVVFWPLSVLALYYGVAAVVTKFLVTVFCTFRHFIEAIQAVPTNWRRVVFCTDSFYLPEVVPEKENSNIVPFYDFRTAIGSFRWSFEPQPSRNDEIDKMLWSASRTAMISCALIYIPVMMYRWSLKASSIVYAPLVWISHTPFAAMQVSDKLRDVSGSPWYKITRLYSVVVLLGGILSITLYLYEQSVIRHIYPRNVPILAFIWDMYLPPLSEELTLKGWHLSRWLSALLAIMLWLFADIAQSRLAAGTWQPVMVERCLKAEATTVRVLVVYTLFCTFWRAWQLEIWKSFPPIKVQWLPFSI